MNIENIQVELVSLLVTVIYGCQNIDTPLTLWIEFHSINTDFISHYLSRCQDSMFVVGMIYLYI